jgi:5-methylcytosine-specific restriction endonuclease McrA
VKLRNLPARITTIETRRVKPTTVRDTRNLSTYAWQRTRLRILREANGLCQCEDCRTVGRIRPAHEVDHIVPVWAGGGEGDNNLQAINRECHALKTAREATERERFT